MSFYLNLFSVSTWDAFRRNGSGISGFSLNQATQASRIEPGSIFLCYAVRLSRWIGALKTESTSFEDHTPIYSEDDQWPIRFNVEPIVLLDPITALPIRNDEIWSRLEWTRDRQMGQVGWGANFQRSLRPISDSDGDFLLDLLNTQDTDRIEYPFSQNEERIVLQPTRVQTRTGMVELEVPDEEEEEQDITEDTTETIRQSLQVQAALARIGAAMGFEVWLPQNDRTRLGNHLGEIDHNQLLDNLPFAFDATTTRTIENIDVLWVHQRTIIRAFEVEHTTSVYSGLLRMADLLSLVPNVNIPIHIVAAETRREKVFREIYRPVFFLMEGCLSRRCTFITYENVFAIESTPNLQHMNHTIVDEYAESRDY